MDSPRASRFISRLGLRHQLAEVTNSPGSRYNNGEIGHMTDHIFYTGFNIRES
ncbi:hypothetical protein AYI68_g4011, partial [Smittium mucronatum]